MEYRGIGASELVHDVPRVVRAVHDNVLQGGDSALAIVRLDKGEKAFHVGELKIHVKGHEPAAYPSQGGFRALNNNVLEGGSIVCHTSENYG